MLTTRQRTSGLKPSDFAARVAVLTGVSAEEVWARLHCDDMVCSSSGELLSTCIRIKVVPYLAGFAMMDSNGASHRGEASLSDFDPDPNVVEYLKDVFGE